MKIDAHHHLWDLNAVNYPWLMEKGTPRFFGDPTSIQRNYLLDEFRSSLQPHGITGSVHIQVGAESGWEEAKWVQSVADANPDWPMAQVVFVDLTSESLGQDLDRFQTLSTVRGVRQIVGRAPGEDAATGTNSLIKDPRFLTGLQMAGEYGLSFDLQLIPDLIDGMASVLKQCPQTEIALCHAGSPYDRSSAGLQLWKTELLKLANLPNVTCKVSGLGMFDHNWTVESFKPVVEGCLEAFGADRCMYGSNFPVDSLYSNYQRLFECFSELVPKENHTSFFGETAQNFYKF